MKKLVELHPQVFTCGCGSNIGNIFMRGIDFNSKYGKNIMISCANVQIISAQPGVIVFKMVGIDIPPDKKWNGIMNIIKFTGKATGKTAVSVTYERSDS